MMELTSIEFHTVVVLHLSEIVDVANRPRVYNYLFPRLMRTGGHTRSERGLIALDQSLQDQLQRRKVELHDIRRDIHDHWDELSAYIDEEVLPRVFDAMEVLQIKQTGDCKVNLSPRRQCGHRLSPLQKDCLGWGPEEKSMLILLTKKYNLTNAPRASVFQAAHDKFDGKCDYIICDGWVAALNQAFARMFDENTSLKEDVIAFEKELRHAYEDKDMSMEDWWARIESQIRTAAATVNVNLITRREERAAERANKIAYEIGDPEEQALPKLSAILTKAEGPEKFPHLEWHYRGGGMWSRQLREEQFRATCRAHTKSKPAPAQRDAGPVPKPKPHVEDDSQQIHAGVQGGPPHGKVNGTEVSARLAPVTSANTLATQDVQPEAISEDVMELSDEDASDGEPEANDADWTPGPSKGSGKPDKPKQKPGTTKAGSQAPKSKQQSAAASKRASKRAEAERKRLVAGWVNSSTTAIEFAMENTIFLRDAITRAENRARGEPVPSANDGEDWATAGLSDIDDEEKADINLPFTLVQEAFQPAPQPTSQPTIPPTAEIQAALNQNHSRYPTGVSANEMDSIFSKASITRLQVSNRCWDVVEVTREGSKIVLKLEKSSAPDFQKAAKWMIRKVMHLPEVILLSGSNKIWTAPKLVAQDLLTVSAQEEKHTFRWETDHVELVNEQELMAIEQWFVVLEKTTSTKSPLAKQITGTPPQEQITNSVGTESGEVMSGVVAEETAANDADAGSKESKNSAKRKRSYGEAGEEEEEEVMVVGKRRKGTAD